MRLTLAFAALLTLGACAGTTDGDRYTSALDRHSAECEAKGGILSPTGAQTGRVETDYACRMTSATRIP